MGKYADGTIDEVCNQKAVFSLEHMLWKTEPETEND